MSSQVQSLLAFVRERPRFAVDVLRDILKLEVPAFTEARFVQPSFEVLPPAERRADTVVLWNGETPVFSSVIEGLERPDPRKRFTWPVYAVGVWARFQCPVVLVVFASDQPTGEWAAESINLGPCCPDWRPYVVGPEGVQVVANANANANGNANASANANGNANGVGS